MVLGLEIPRCFKFATTFSNVSDFLVEMAGTSATLKELTIAACFGQLKAPL
jgi:hypothetical protein